MININLLPWREERKKTQQIQFFVFAGIGLGIVLCALGLWNMTIQSKIDTRLAQNILLKNEISMLDGKLASIKNLKEEKAQLLARIRTVQHLQDTRVKTVKLLEGITKAVPEGLFLTELSRKEDRVVIEGNATSNSQVAQFMRNIENTEELESPVLSVIQANEEDDGGLIEFNLQAVHSGFALENENKEE